MGYKFYIIIKKLIKKGLKKYTIANEFNISRVKVSILSNCISHSNEKLYNGMIELLNNSERIEYLIKKQEEDKESWYKKRKPRGPDKKKRKRRSKLNNEQE